MKRLLLLVAAMYTIMAAGHAQTKQLKKMIISDDYTLEFTYDDEGRMIGVSGDEQCTITYTYDQIMIQATDDGDTWNSTYSLTNGLLTQEDREGDLSDIYYDAENRITKWDFHIDGNNYPLEFIWEDGNIVRTKRYKGTELRTEVTYTYNHITAHPLIHCLWGGLDFIGWPECLPLYPYMGTLPKNLVTSAENVSGHGNYSYEYELNSDGDIVKILEYYDGELEDTYTFEWEPSTSGISSIENEQNVPSAFYSINGMRSTKAHHGPNIVRYANGKVRKYMAR